MKVILLGCTPPPVGGIAKWTTRMMNTGLPHGWDLELVDEKMIGRESFGDQMKVNYWVETKRWMKIWAKLIFKLMDKEAVVVHSCPIGSKNAMLAESVNACLSRLFKMKVVLHFRCTLPNMIDSDFKKRLLKFICSRGHYIIALNSQTKEYLADITDTKVEVVPNFIDDTEILATEKEIREAVKTVVYTGGVTEEKGCIDIVNIAKAFPDISFRLVGRLSGEVVEAARGMSNVVLTGIKDNDGVKEELQNADVFMFLSAYPGEGFSNALAEAMAMGLPCIVTDWAANADMVKHGDGGYVINRGDIDAGVEAVRKISDFAVRKAQSEYNLEKVKTFYTQSSVVEKYVEIYESLVCK